MSIIASHLSMTNATLSSFSNLPWHFWWSPASNRCRTSSNQSLFLPRIQILSPSSIWCRSVMSNGQIQGLYCHVEGMLHCIHDMAGSCFLSYGQSILGEFLGNLWSRHILLFVFIFMFLLSFRYFNFFNEWYHSLTAHQHQKGHTVPKQA